MTADCDDHLSSPSRYSYLEMTRHFPYSYRGITGIYLHNKGMNTTVRYAIQVCMGRALQIQVAFRWVLGYLLYSKTIHHMGMGYRHVRQHRRNPTSRIRGTRSSYIREGNPEPGTTRYNASRCMYISVRICTRVYMSIHGKYCTDGHMSICAYISVRARVCIRRQENNECVCMYMTRHYPLPLNGLWATKSKEHEVSDGHNKMLCQQLCEKLANSLNHSLKKKQAKQHVRQKIQEGIL